MTILTNDGLLAVAGLLNVQTLPLVLAVGPQQDSAAAWTAAQNEALAGLRRSGLVDGYDDVDTDLAAALHVLAQPDRELVARIHTGAGVRRACLARRGDRHAVATRVDDVLDVRTTWADATGAMLARPLLDVLGTCPPAAATSFSAPAETLRERLDGAADSRGYTQALYDLGVEERTAIEFGLALSTCTAYSEIVAYAHGEGVTHRSIGAVVVYDTERGRLVACPGTSPDQQLWSTFTPGSDHRIAEAVSALVHSLPVGGWMA
ncbi:ESX secretion-associated protein EspG [Nocardia sp. NPDC051750]|uniref:ESX secretion-associated protein EspG n=1 Tax=Nocardia sp. NPDC051750 TaxID=3364325 RepID=UPI0037BBC575